MLGGDAKVIQFGWRVESEKKEGNIDLLFETYRHIPNRVLLSKTNQHFAMSSQYLPEYVQTVLMALDLAQKEARHLNI